MTVAIVIIAAIMFIGCSIGENDTSALSYDQLIEKARTYDAQGDAEKAISLYKKALVIKPDAGYVHYILGDIYYREWKLSRKNAQDQLAADIFMNPPHQPPDDHQKALIARGLKAEYKDFAVKEFHEALKYDPANWGARFWLGSDLLGDKKYAQAIDELLKVIEIKPDYPNSYSLLGTAYMKLGQNELAVKYLKKSIELMPSDYDYYELGLVYRKMNRGEEVATILKMLKDKHSPMYDELRLSLFNGADKSEE